MLLCRNKYTTDIMYYCNSMLPGIYRWHLHVLHVFSILTLTYCHVMTLTLTGHLWSLCEGECWQGPPTSQEVFLSTRRCKHLVSVVVQETALCSILNSTVLSVLHSIWCTIKHKISKFT